MKNIILLSIIGCLLSGCPKPSDDQKAKKDEGAQTGLERKREAERLARQSSEEAQKASEESIHGAEDLAKVLSAAEKAMAAGEEAANEGLADIKESSEKAAVAAYEHAATAAEKIADWMKEDVKKLSADATQIDAAKIAKMESDLAETNAIIEAMKPLNSKEGDLYKNSKDLLAKANTIAKETADLVSDSKHKFTKKEEKKEKIATKAFDDTSNFSLRVSSLQNMASEIANSKSTLKEAKEAVFDAKKSLDAAIASIAKATSEGADVTNEKALLSAEEAKLTKAKAAIGAVVKEKVAAATKEAKSKFDAGGFTSDLDRFVDGLTGGKGKFTDLISRIQRYRNYYDLFDVKAKEQELQKDIKNAELAEAYASTPEGKAEIIKYKALGEALKNARRKVDEELASVVENNPGEIKDKSGGALSVKKDAFGVNSYKFYYGNSSSPFDINKLEEALKIHGVNNPLLLANVIHLDNAKLSYEKELDAVEKNAIKTPAFGTWLYMYLAHRSLKKYKEDLAKLNEGKTKYQQAWKELETNLEEFVVKDAGL